jgi:hypothetical protein
MAGADVLVIFLSALGIFFVVHGVVQRTITSLLHGRLSGIYLEYVHSRQGRKADRAFEREDEHAWDEIADAKLEELGAYRYDRRERALDYLEHVEPTKKLATKLIEVLPYQNRLTVQARAACLLCRTLEELRQREEIEDEEIESKSPTEERLRMWGNALSIWFTEVVCLFGILWSMLDQLPISLVIVISVAAFLATVLPWIMLVRSRAGTVNAVLFSVFLVLGVLWFFASQRHVCSNPMVNWPVKGYAPEEITVTVDYCSWLTADDIGSGKRLEIELPSDDLPPIIIERDRDVICLEDEDHKSSPPSPVISATRPSGQTFVFYVKPRNVDVLMTETTTITLRVQDTTPGQQATLRRPLPIHLEHPYWKVFRDICKALGGTSLIAFVWRLIDRITKARSGSSP